MVLVKFAEIAASYRTVCRIRHQVKIQMENTATPRQRCQPHSTVSLYNITPRHNKPDVSRVRSRGYVRVWTMFLSPRPRPTIHHPKISKVSPIRTNDENTEDTQRKIQCAAPRHLGPEELGGTQELLAGPLVWWPKTRVMRRCSTIDDVDLSPGRVFVMSDLCEQSMRSVLCPALSRNLALGARYIPPGFHQQKYNSRRGGAYGVQEV